MREWEELKSVVKAQNWLMWPLVNKSLQLDKMSQGKENQSKTFPWNLAKFKILPGKSSEKCILAVIGGEWILSIDTGN